MTDEMNEIVRVLQLTSYDEDEWDADNVTVMKKAMVSVYKVIQHQQSNYSSDRH